MTVIHGFAGMRVRRGDLCFDPWLPKKWQQLGFTINWQGSLLNIKITHSQISFKLVSGENKSLVIKVKGKPVTLKADKLVKAKLK